MTGTRRHLSCVLADDHDAVRTAVRRQLDGLPWVRVVAEAGDGEAALSAIRAHQPDVAVVDVRMPRASGIEVCKRTVALGLGTRIVLFSSLADPASVDMGLRVGAAAYVSKDEGFTPLRDALQSLL